MGKDTPHKQSWPAYAKFTIILLGIILFFYALRVAGNLLIPLAFSFLLALLLYPLAKWLELKRIPRVISIIISIVLVVIALGAIGFVLTNELIGFSDEIPEITDRLQISISGFQSFIETNFEISKDLQIDWLTKGLNNLLQTSAGFFPSLLQSTSSFLTKLGILPFYLFFILYYRDIFKEFFFRISPQEQHEKVASILFHIQKVIQNYLSGLFTVIVIIAILNSTALLIIGVNHAIFFGIFAAILTIIPYVGVFIGSWLPTLYALAMYDSIWVPVAVIGSFTAIQSLEGNIITPNIVGSKVSINPLVAIVALLAGAEVWGVSGMIMFVPFTAMLKVIFDHIDPLKPYGLLLGTDKKNLTFPEILKRINPKNLINKGNKK